MPVLFSYNFKKIVRVKINKSAVVLKVSKSEIKHKFNKLI